MTPTFLPRLAVLSIYLSTMYYVSCGAGASLFRSLMPHDVRSHLRACTPCSSPCCAGWFLSAAFSPGMGNSWLWNLSSRGDAFFRSFRLPLQRERSIQMAPPLKNSPLKKLRDENVEELVQNPALKPILKSCQKLT